MDYKGILVGLGNPGSKYDGTRHNTGFLFVDRLLATAERDGQVSVQNGARFSCELWKVTLNSLGGCWLVAKPLTFMNLSGESVQPLLAWHRLTPDELVVVHDELDLPPGSLRFKLGGGNAGHNGLKSITQQLGTPDFYRLRLGIGRPIHRTDVINWVLGRPEQTDRELWVGSMEAGLSVLSAFAAKGLDAAVRTASSETKRLADSMKDDTPSR